MDKAIVEIEHAKCGDTNEHIEKNYTEESSVEVQASSTVCIGSLAMCISGQTLDLITLINLMVILIILLSIFMKVKKSDKKLSLYDDSIGHITKEAFLTTKDDFEIDHQIYKFF